jgi:UPF0716 protein FxsA
VFAKLLLLFILIPLVELYLFLVLGGRIGVPATIGIIILTGFLGAALTKSQGARALARFRKASAEGRLPHQEVIDGLLILIAGAVLLTPGFLTDVAGFLLLVPPVRAHFRQRLATYLKSRVRIVPGAGPPPSEGAPPPPAGKGKIIDVEVVNED